MAIVIGKQCFKYLLAVVFLSALITACINNTENATDYCEQVPAGEWTSLGLQKADDIYSVAVHPDDPETIYVGSSYNFSDGIQGKLFKTTDCGAHWDTLFAGNSVRTIQYEPDNPEVVYVLNSNDVLKSTDAGSTWSSLQNGIRLNWETFSHSLVIHPEDPSILYVGTGGFFGGRLYKSTNGGKSWNELTSGFPEDPNRDILYNSIVSIALNRRQPNQILAGTAENGDLLLSNDAGENWSKTNLVNTGVLIKDLGIYNHSSKDIIYAGLNKKGLYKSNKDIQSFNRIENEYLNDTTSIADIEINNDLGKMAVLTATPYGGKLLMHDFKNKTWDRVEVPANINSTYSYNTIELYNKNSLYKFFGTADGLYLKKEKK